MPKVRIFYALGNIPTYIATEEDIGVTYLFVICPRKSLSTYKSYLTKARYKLTYFKTFLLKEESKN